MGNYGQKIRWTERDGSVMQITVEGIDTAEEARILAIKDAKAFGWTPAKWWQWWRRNDTKLTID